MNDFGFHNISLDILDTLGVDESTILDNQVSIFPNPSNGDMTIKNTVIALDKAMITDLNGRTILTFNLNGRIGNQDLKMNSVLSTGMYLLTILSEKGSATKKLMIR